MPRQSKPGDPEELRRELVTMLEDFEHLLAKGELRERVRYLIPINYTLADLGASQIKVEDGTSLRAARQRMLLYLLEYLGEVIDGEELAVVSGISEYRRRLGELRTKFGWSLITGNTVRQTYEEGELDNKYHNMRPDQYALLSDVRDVEAADRWHLANDIRKSSGGVGKKVLEYLKVNVGKIIPAEELRYVANGKGDWQRRTRELRTEKGWKVITNLTGEVQMPPGSYMLADLEQEPEHDRIISNSVRVEVLDRDRFACRKCGWKREDRGESDPRKFLELHHIEHHAEGGENTAENIITLCNVHHDEVHQIDKSKEWTVEEFEEWLKK